jgi:diadenosine tetraphosphate (Ap4A) HIT family hydrolase
MACELCAEAGGRLVWQNDEARVVLVDDPAHPGFCRVILREHVAEMTDLAEPRRAALMRLVFAVESALRALLPAHKINLASLGNVVPHLHWHVIPRYLHDPEFPSPIWAPPHRSAGGLPPAPDPEVLRGAVERALAPPP